MTTYSNFPTWKTQSFLQDGLIKSCEMFSMEQNFHILQDVVRMKDENDCYIWKKISNISCECSSSCGIID